MARLKRIVERSFFFATDSRSLSLFRFLYCALCAYQLWATIGWQTARHAKGIFHPIPLFQLFGIGLMDAETFALVRGITIAALLLAAIGLFTRTALTVAWIGFFFYYGTVLSFTKDAHSDYVTHTQNIVIFMLWILSAAPGVAIWGVDGWRKRGFRWQPPESLREISAWPTQLVKLVLGICYFGAGYCKVWSHPLWADGYTLQAYMLQKHMLIDNPAALWMAEHWWLCLFAGVTTLLLELAFWIVPFVPRAVQWLFAAGGIGFHLMIYITMSIDFFPYWGFVYFVFLDWPTLQAIGRFFTRGFAAGAEALRAVALAWPRGTVVGATPFARGFSLVFAAVMLFCIFAHIEAWPFSDFRVFQKRKHYRIAHVFRIAGVEAEGERSWLDRNDLVGSPVSTNSRIRRSYQAKEPQTVEREFANQAKQLSEASRRRFESVQLIHRTVEPHPDTPHRFRIVDTPILAIAVSPTEIGQVEVLCDYLGDPAGCDMRPAIQQVAAPPPT
jgi:hypothetical protein